MGESKIIGAALIEINIVLCSYSVIVFINRGWVPKTLKEWNKPTGKISLNAVFSKPDKKTSFSPVHNPDSGILLWYEGEAILKASKLDKTVDQVSLFEADRKCRLL